MLEITNVSNRSFRAPIEANFAIVNKEPAGLRTAQKFKPVWLAKI